MATTGAPPKEFTDQVTNWYQQLLGRAPSAAEVQSHYGNPSGLDGVYGAIANSKEAADYKIRQAAAPPPASPSTAEQTIDSLYKTANIKDGGPGSGFADRAYWLAHPSEITNGRLGSDLAGTGPDQPDGTPGSGVWSNSGTADRAKKAAAAAPAPTATVPGAPSLATLYSLANVGQQGPVAAPTSNTSIGLAQANAAPPAAIVPPPVNAAPSLMDLARLYSRGAV